MTPKLGGMDRVIARTADGVPLVSVVTLVDGELRHYYQLRGGPDNGQTFDSLGKVFTDAAVHGLQLTDTDD